MEEKIKTNVKGYEKITYGAYFIGQNVIYWLVTSYLMFYYTQNLKIPPLFVSAIFLVAKIWDAINDPLFGGIMDKANFKSGKLKPWILLSTIVLPVITFFMFVIPESFNLTTKIVLAFITYLLWDLFYTVGDVPVFALASSMSENVKERANIVGIGRFGSMVGGFILSTFLVPLLDKSNGYFIIAIIMVAVCYITMLPLCFTAKERCVVKEENKEGGNLKEIWAYLKSNKFLMIFFAAFILWGCFEISMNSYQLHYCFGTFKYSSYQTLIAVVPTLLTYFLIPIIIKRVDKMKVYIVSCAIIILLSVVQYFIGYKNEIGYLAIFGVKSFVTTARSILMFTFAADCLEYGEYKSGIRKEGVTFAVQTFSAKFGAAIAGALTGVILHFMGLNEEMTVEVSATFADKVWLVSNLFPLIGPVLSIPVLLLYKLNDKNVQIMSDCNHGKITKEQAEQLLGEAK